MTKRTCTMAIVLVALLGGCGPDPVVREAREMRSAGLLPEARETVLVSLRGKPAQMDLWLEFARIAVDQSRQADRAGNPRAIHFLVEASLVCGAHYAYKRQAPPDEWKAVSRLAAGEATKNANRTMTTLRAQIQSADYLAQLLEFRRGDSGLDGARMSAVQMVEEYRANARVLLFQSVLAVRLLEMLPEVSPGSSSLLVSQIQSARDDWRRALELPPDMADTILQRANTAVDRAYERMLDDLRTLGYYLPGTVIENGILE